jgi:transcriptional regulator with XRE-family HTH domain
MTDYPYILDGPRIRVIREGCGMTLPDLAVAMGLARSTGAYLGGIEAEKRLPSREYAVRIAEALGVFLGDITRHGPYVTPWRTQTPPQSIAAPIGERLAAKTEVDANGCWIWLGRINGFGYGEIKCGERRLKAHRVSYEHHVGPIPEGLDLDHLCRVRPCVNPEHLEPVTRSENVRRGHQARRAAA